MRLKSAVIATAAGVVLVQVLAGCQLGRGGMGTGLSSVDPVERAKAVVALGEAGDTSAVPLLVDRLEDEDEVVRLFAVEALVRLTGKDMGYRYYDPPWLRARAVRRWRSQLTEAQWSQPVDETPQ